MRFILEKYNGKSTRYLCPQCLDKRKTFTRYIDTETNEHLSHLAGVCGRKDKCGYHYTPKEFFGSTGQEFKPTKVEKIVHEPKPISYLDYRLVSASKRNYDQNNFVTFLKSKFDNVESVCNQYNIGTCKWYLGGNVFWQIDAAGKVRSGKIMQYDKQTGKRGKYSNWVHVVTKQSEFNLQQCFFGMHLITDKPIAIIESEKTAIICALVMPEYTWLATGGRENLNDANLQCLIGKDVTLFPDLSINSSTYIKWQKKAEPYKFKVSDYLEKIATDEHKKQGLDLADFILNDL